MPCIKGILVASLGFFSDFLSAKKLQQTADDVGNWATIQASEVVIAVPREFKSVLSSIPRENIQSVLHKHLPNYKDGIFEEEAKAVEEIYKRSPPMANKLVAAARYDVLRRQNGNLTTSSRPPVVTPTTPVTLTETNAQGSVFLTTFTPTGGVVTSRFIQTTTLPDGSKSTFTSIAVVPAPTGSTQGGPSLQGEASSFQGPVTLSGVIVLALSFAGFLLL